MSRYQLKEESLLYDPGELEIWKSNADDCIDFLVKSKAAVSIKRSLAYRKGFILDEKGRYDRRRTDDDGKPVKPRTTMHYDAAKVAVSLSADTKAGWYGSYDWMTDKSWISSPKDFNPKASDGRLAGFMKEYQRALIDHIHKDKLSALQAAAGRLTKVAPPDFWFIANDGSLLFVEAKLDLTPTKEAQVTTLALLKTVLGAEVRIVRVRKNRSIALNDFSEKFGDNCGLR